jgi:uncharacterized membrane protein YhiD involved in acid resistance
VSCHDYFLYGFGYWDSIHVNTADPITRDPARLAAQVVTGIGFLGAGTIVQTGTDIKGLTTATTIWMAMAIGLACRRWLLCYRIGCYFACAFRLNQHAQDRKDCRPS